MSASSRPLRIVAAIPCYSGYLTDDTSRSLENLFVYATQASPRIEWGRVASVGNPVLPRVRNSLVATALSQGADGVLFIDDDIGFDAKDVYRMIGHGLGLVGAIPQMRNSRWNDPPRLAVSANGLRINPERGLAVSPQSLPMALTFISAKVFHAIRAAGLAPQIMYAGVEAAAQEHMAMYFGYEARACPEWSDEAKLAKQLGIANPMVEDGEDNYFCRRAAAAGFDSVIDLEVELRHWEGRVCHDYSLKKFLAENPGGLRPTAVKNAG
jgi:hypothetical protein